MWYINLEIRGSKSPPPFIVDSETRKIRKRKHKVTEIFRETEIFNMTFGNGSVAFAIIWGIVLSFYVLHGSFNYHKLISFGILPLVGSSLVLSYPAFDLTQLTALVLFTAIITIGAHSKSNRISSRLSIGFVS